MDDATGLNLPPCFWTNGGRWAVFLLSFSSIAGLLFDFYGLCPMRISTPFIFVPAMAVLLGLAFFDRVRGDERLWRGVVIGLLAGLLAALAYDAFRLPFVFAKELGIRALVPPLDLFKAFPRFGAMILGQPIEQSHYSAAAQGLGWSYHFSNGATFGVMYLAMIGDATRRHWSWAVVMALGLELGMLATPYPQVFHIALTTRFVLATIAAHAIFGVGLGLAARWLAARLNLSVPQIRHRKLHS